MLFRPAIVVMRQGASSSETASATAIDDDSRKATRARRNVTCFKAVPPWWYRREGHGTRIVVGIPSVGNHTVCVWSCHLSSGEWRAAEAVSIRWLEFGRVAVAARGARDCALRQ